MEQITHESVKRLVYQLPKPFQDKFFAWRDARFTERKLIGRGAAVFYTTEFIAECLQKAVSLHAEVDRVLAAWSGDKAKTDSQPTKESPDGAT